MESIPAAMIRPQRKITGMSAVLLPYNSTGQVDWSGLEAHIERTAAAGLIPAVNMDTGYANLIDEATRREVLACTNSIMRGDTFVAGAFVADHPQSSFDLNAYRRQIEPIESYGGTPIIMQSFGLTGGDVISAYEQIAGISGQFLAFELGQMFASFGAIYDLKIFSQLMDIPNCIGAKHSSLNRQLEWQRLRLREAQRPEFMILTGNDLAIDMVMYGSDYLLGLSTFAPDLFARRDAYWLAGDAAFYELNDVLQYLGFFAFRTPVPAYKHSAAQFLKLRGWLDSDQPHQLAQKRPDSDKAVLQEILMKLETL